MFYLAVFLYPFNAMGHTLYLLPQLIFCVACLSNLVSRRNPPARSIDGVIAFGVFFSVIVPILVEFCSDGSNYSQVSKMVVNGIFLCLAGNSGFAPYTQRSFKYIRAIVLVWLSTIAFLYTKSGVTFASLAIKFSANDLTSQMLYQAADPLNDVFITKNIIAMYFVSLLAVYLFFYQRMRRSTINNVLDLMLFVLLIVSCFSRQALLGGLVVCAAAYFYGNTTSKLKIYVAVLGALWLGISIFKSLFNLSSSGDGANQRLELWADFFDKVPSFWLTGRSFDGLSNDLNARIGIDNYHMFFMNQIGTYGVIHAICLNLAIVLVLMSGKSFSQVMVLAVCYYVNVLFQTYGYEYQNILPIAVAYMFIRSRQSSSAVIRPVGPVIPSPVLN